MIRIRHADKGRCNVGIFGTPFEDVTSEKVAIFHIKINSTVTILLKYPTRVGYNEPTILVLHVAVLIMNIITN